MGKRTKFPIDFILYTKEGTIKIKKCICAKGKLFDMLILNSPRKGFHIHKTGLQKGVITEEGKKKKYQNLTKSNFERLKGGKK